MYKSKLPIRLFFLMFFSAFFGEISAQMNIKIGYSIGYMKAPTTNTIIGEFNQNHSFYENQLEDFKFLHGVLVGLRYRVNDVAFHLDWNNKFNLLQGSGVDSSGVAAYQKLYFKNSSYGFGLEFFGSERFSLGGTIDLNALRYRNQNNEITTKTTILKDYSWGSHFYVSINIEGTDILTLNLQPYIQIPWSSFDLHTLDNALNTKNTTDKISEKYLNFGLRIVFSNGSF